MTGERFDGHIVWKTGSRRPDWHESKSPYGYVLGEVISAMGKEIRRGNDYHAVYWAHQMAISGSAAEDFLWERLRVIAMEDCGPANPLMLVVVDAAYRLYKDLPPQWEERNQVVSYTVCCLTLSPKTHYSYELFGEMVRRLRDDGERLEIPDYAVDFHTRRGKALGRGLLHFLEEGWKITNEAVQFPSKWRDALLKRARQAEDKKDS